MEGQQLYGYKGINKLTHLSRMEFRTLPIGPVHFRLKGCWVALFHFYSNFNRTL